MSDVGRRAGLSVVNGGRVFARAKRRHSSPVPVAPAVLRISPNNQRFCSLRHDFTRADVGGPRRTGR